LSIKIIIADDHPIFLAGLKEIISYDDVIEVIDESSEGLKAVEIIKNQKPDYDNGTYIGINTTNPQSELDVNGVLTVRKGASNTSVIQSNSANAQIDFITDRSDSSNLAFKFTNSADSNLMTIRADGKVGIGTSSPQSELDVNGVLTVRKGASNASVIQSNNADARMDFITDRGNKSNLAFKFTNSADSNLMTIRANGKVGIGGDVKADEYKYNTTQTRKMRINPTTLNHFYQGTKVNPLNGVINFRATTTAIEYFNYSIQLPQGAIITGSSVEVFDNGGGVLSYRLMKSNSGGNTSYQFSANSSNSSSYQTLSTTGSEIINNNTHSYILKIKATSGTISSATIRAIIITYTVDSVE